MRRWTEEENTWLVSNIERLVKEGNTTIAASKILAPTASKQLNRNLGAMRVYQLYRERRRPLAHGTVETARLDGWTIFVARVTDKLAIPCDSIAEALRLVQGDVKQYLFWKAKPVQVEYKTILEIKDV